MPLSKQQHEMSQNEVNSEVGKPPSRVSEPKWGEEDLPARLRAAWHKERSISRVRQTSLWQDGPTWGVRS